MTAGLQERRIIAARGCAARGLSQKQTADELGTHPTIICQLARKHGIAFAHGNIGQGVHDVERAASMAALYRDGYTLERIGTQYGLTRERVRQIIKKRHGLTAVDGGRYEQSNKKKAATRALREERCQQQNGCSLAQYKDLRAIGRATMKNGETLDRTPVRAFSGQKRNAIHHRGIEWKLTLWEWWTIWQMSGHWEERGRGRGYMMCRKGDTGPYAVGNVVIATGVFNGSVQPNNPNRRGHPLFNETMERRYPRAQSEAA